MHSQRLPFKDVQIGWYVRTRDAVWIKVPLRNDPLFGPKFNAVRLDPKSTSVLDNAIFLDGLAIVEVISREEGHATPTANIIDFNERRAQRT